MGQFYIVTPKGLTFELDATQDMTYSLSGSPTDNPIETGESVADHYIQNPSTIDVSGVITDIYNLSSSSKKVSTTDYINSLIELKNSKAPFKLVIGEHLKAVNNCVFTRLDFSNNNELGLSRTTGDLIASYKVAFTVQQIRFAAIANTITSLPRPDIQDMTQPKVESAQTTKKPDKKNGGIYVSSPIGGLVALTLGGN